MSAASRMTAILFDTLAWLVEREAATGAVPSQADACVHFGVDKGTMAYRWRKVIAVGAIAIEGGPRGGRRTSILEAGRALVAAGKDAATVRASHVPAYEEPLPAFAIMAPASLPLLRAIHAAAQAGRVISYGELATLLGKDIKAISSQVRTLRRRGTVEPVSTRPAEERHIQISALGAAVAEGRVRIGLREPSDVKPSAVGLSEDGLATLKVIRGQNLAGQPLKAARLAKLLDATPSTISARLFGLRQRGLVDLLSVELTTFGIEVAEGRVSTERPPTPKRQPRQRARKTPAPRAVRPSVASCRTPAPPPPIRQLGTPLAEPPAVPALPPRIATLRGIRHPAPPQAHAAPKGMREDTWDAMTTLRSPMASGWS